MFSLDESIYNDKKTTTKDDSFIDNYNEDSKIEEGLRNMSNKNKNIMVHNNKNTMC